MLFCTLTHSLQDIPNGNAIDKKNRFPEHDLQIHRLTFVAAPTRYLVDL
jgi:hypothetical protein